MPLSGLTGAPIFLPQGSTPPAVEGPSYTESVEEARSRELDFPAAERSIYVKDMIQKVAAYRNAGDSLEIIRERLPLFARDYPHLLEMIMDPHHDEHMLKTMLAMIDRMAEKTLTQHQASVIVGQRLFEKAKK
jgi:hypothetical protein